MKDIIIFLHNITNPNYTNIQSNHLNEIITQIKLSKTINIKEYISQELLTLRADSQRRAVMRS